MPSKFLYYQYGVCWIPYSIQPRIAISNHWNRSGTVRVDVWSNCPKVRLLVNGVSQGEKVPNGQLGASGGINDVSNATTQLPFQCTWTGINWQAGTLRAEGLNESGQVVCFDEKKTAGSPHHVVLTREGPIVKPNGEKFEITANGSDVALILATVVDQNGIWCPTATGTITWSVSGPAEYRGGCDQFVTSGQPYSYHGPGDPELAIEGGKAMVAVRSRFTTGTVTVSANVAGLAQPSASITYEIKPAIDIVSYNANDLLNHSISPEKINANFIVSGEQIKYYISNKADIAFEILNASGKIINKINYSQQQAGWHKFTPINMKANNSSGKGVYFVKMAVNGDYLPAKKLVIIR